MLKKITEGRVENDDGFSIQMDREVLEYTDKGRKLRFNMGYDPGKRKIYVYISMEKLPTHEKNQIERKIKEALKLLKGDYEIV